MKTVFSTHLTLTLVVIVAVSLIEAHPLSQQRISSGESLDVPTYAVVKRDLIAESSAPEPTSDQVVDTNDKFKYGDIVLNGIGGFGYGPGFGMGMPGYMPGGFGNGMGTGAGFGAGMGNGGGYMPNPYYPNLSRRYDNLGNGMGMGNFYGRRYN